MRFTIKLKLALGFAAIIMMAGAMAVVSISNLSSLNTAITDIVQGPAANLRNSSDLSDAILMAIRDEKNAIINTDASKISEYVENVNRHRAVIDAKTTELAAVINPAIREKALQLQSQKPNWFAMQDSVLKLATENTDESNRQAGQISMGQGAKLTESLLEALGALNAEIAIDLKQTDEATNLQYDQSRNLLIGGMALLLVLSVAIAVWIAISISSGLKKIKSVADAVAIGDLDRDIEIRTNDEIRDVVESVRVMTGNLRNTANIADQIANGDLTVSPKPLSDKDILGLSLQSMVERLRGVVADALAAADNVSSGSQELSASSEQLSQGATEQASSAEEAS
ncbi:HAMP domain-containing protein, partial [Agrobacterium sp. a22-2]|uniref:MCP four helix bundle domain-containing protein n=1 Tax=Agrobacterium sp. a22-2 TaxID=2283840 RepID=UPI0014465502